MHIMLLYDDNHIQREIPLLFICGWQSHNIYCVTRGSNDFASCPGHIQISSDVLDDSNFCMGDSSYNEETVCDLSAQDVYSQSISGKLSHSTL